MHAFGVRAARQQSLGPVEDHDRITQQLGRRVGQRLQSAFREYHLDQANVTGVQPFEQLVLVRNKLVDPFELGGPLELYRAKLPFALEEVAVAEGYRRLGADGGRIGSLGVTERSRGRCAEPHGAMRVPQSQRNDEH